jgi:hypothetical protein
MEESAVKAGEAGAETDLVAMIDLKGREAGAATNLVALALGLNLALDLILALNLEDRGARAATDLIALTLNLILALAPKDGEGGAATDLFALALYLRGVTALKVTPHQKTKILLFLQSMILVFYLDPRHYVRWRIQEICFQTDAELYCWLLGFTK